MNQLTDRKEAAAYLRELRAKLRFDQKEMGEALGISREWVSKLENEKEDFSEFVVLKLQQLQRELGSEARTRIAEVPVGGNTSISHQRQNQTVKGSLNDDPMRVNSRFQPPAAHPTPEDCRAHLNEYLRRAAVVPGGIGFAYRLLIKHLPLEEFAPLEDDEDKG